MIKDYYQRLLRTLTSLFLTLLVGACVTNPLLEKKKSNRSSLFADDSQRVIAPELLRLDVEQLLESIYAVHPEAFSVFPEQEFLQAVELVKQSIYYPMTSNEFYLRVAPLVAKLRDIHSHIVIPKKDLSRTDFSQQRPAKMLFPLAVLYENDAFYVAADLSVSPKVPAGARVIAINDIPIGFILDKMAKLIAWETETGLRRKIQIEFPWLMAALGYAGKSYSVKYQWQQQIFTETLEAIKPVTVFDSIEQSSAELTDKPASGESLTEIENGNLIESQSQNSFYGFSQINHDTVLLWFNDFYEKPLVFKQFLDSQFKRFAEAGVDNLIIDLRYNDGGRSQNIKSLLSYISRREIYWSYRAEIKISQPLQALYLAATEQRRKNKFSWGLQWLPLEWTDLLQYEVSWSNAGEKVNVNLEPIQPSDYSFNGNIKVLNNGFCFSACAAFVATVNSNQLAETIGEMAGSVARIQYVYPISTELKNSRLTLSLPTVKLYHSENETSRQLAIGVSRNLVRPQIEVNRSDQQIAARLDSSLSEALKRTKSD